MFYLYIIYVNVCKLCIICICIHLPRVNFLDEAKNEPCRTHEWVRETHNVGGESPEKENFSSSIIMIREMVAINAAISCFIARKILMEDNHYYIATLDHGWMTILPFRYSPRNFPFDITRLRLAGIREMRYASAIMKSFHDYRLSILLEKLRQLAAGQEGLKVFRV